MNKNNVLSRIPGNVFAEATDSLPSASKSDGNTQRVIVRLPDGSRAEVTFVKTKFAKGRSARWFWTPKSAVILDIRERNKGAENFT